MRVCGILQGRLFSVSFGSRTAVGLLALNVGHQSEPGARWPVLPGGGVTGRRQLLCPPDRDEALADVAKQVRRAVEAVAGAPASKPVGRRAATAAAQRTEVAVRLASLPRSSNLRLKKEFTEKDRDDFLRSTFDYVCKFFEGSIKAIGERNPDVTGNFDRIDSRRMAAILYRNGKKIAECSVRLEGLSRSDGIAFSHDTSATLGSFNEMLSVEARDQNLHRKSMGMAWRGGDRETQLSQEAAAEFLWELFVAQAQS